MVTLCFALLLGIEWVRLCLWHHQFFFIRYYAYAAPSCGQCRIMMAHNNDVTGNLKFIEREHVISKRIRCWNMRWTWNAVANKNIIFHFILNFAHWDGFLAANELLTVYSSKGLFFFFFFFYFFSYIPFMRVRDAQTRSLFVTKLILCACASVARKTMWTKQKKDEKSSQDKHQHDYRMFLCLHVPILLSMCIHVHGWSFCWWLFALVFFFFKFEWMEISTDWKWTIKREYLSCDR